MAKKSDKNLYVLPIAILVLILLIGAFFVISYLSQNQSIKNNQLSKDSYGSSNFSHFVRNIQSGGPPKDGIPPIENPHYKSVKEVGDFLNEKDVVFVMDYGGVVKIYPQKILVWHEIVNDEVMGEKISVTYCPLTGSVIGYKGYIEKIGKETTYGTSGKLLNSNLVMYDRETGSYIPQILGIGITSDLEGVKLNPFQIIWTTWDLAIQKYPDALVLNDNTGFLRDYNRDPYGSYLENNNYYDFGGPLFPVMYKDNRLKEKEVVIGVRGKDAQVAILKNSLRSEKVKNLQVGSEAIVAIYDDTLDAVRVFSREFGGETLTFNFENGKIIDNLGNKWSVDGTSSQGKLIWIDSFDVMWFAWVAFFPETELVR